MNFGNEDFVKTSDNQKREFTKEFTKGGGEFTKEFAKAKREKRNLSLHIIGFPYYKNANGRTYRTVRKAGAEISEAPY